MTGSPVHISRRPPLVDEHSAEVLAEFGFSPQEIVALRTTGVV